MQVINWIKKSENAPVNGSLKFGTLTNDIFFFILLKHGATNDILQHEDVIKCSSTARFKKCPVTIYRLPKSGTLIIFHNIKDVNIIASRNAQ